MTKLVTMLVLAAAGFDVHAGSEVEKLQMSPGSISNFRQLSDTNGNGTCVVVESGCYLKDNNFPQLRLGSKQTTQTVAMMGRPTVMITDAVAPQEQLVSATLGNLYPDAWSTIRDYPEFTVRNFSWNKSRSSANSDDRGFVVEVDFRLTKKGELQAIAIFGDVHGLGKSDLTVNVASYSDLDDQQEGNRRSLKSLENILNNRDFVSPMAQVQWQDFKRAQAVGATIAAWMSAMRLLPETTTVSSVDIH